MNNWRNFWPLLPAIFFYALIWVLLGPWLGYMLDSDAVAYLTMAEKAAQGDIWRSVNGLWSPLNSWLLVPFIQHGYNPWEAAKVMNAMIGVIILILSYILVTRFLLNNLLRFCFAMCMALMLDYYVYFQIFGDLLQLVFVLIYLLLLWSNGFIHRPYKVITAALVMGIAFYAKAYTSLFFLLHFSVSLFWMYRNYTISLKKILRTWLLGITIFMACLAPWSWAIHKKYDVWSMNGLAGKLNMSWYINSGKTFQDSIHLLIPPPYSDSPSFWEDPYFSQAHLHSPMSSFHHFMRWMGRVALTSLQSVTCMSEISALGLALMVFILFYYFRKDRKDVRIQLLWLTCLILPMGYLVMHIETRYLWLSAILLLVAGFHILEHEIPVIKIRYAATVLLCFSFTYFPMLQFESLRCKNKDLFEKAEWLKEKGIHGSFTSNISDSGQMWVIAYLSGNSFYTIENSGYSFKELNDEIKKYGVQYFVQESENNVDQIQMRDPGWELIASGHNLNVFRINYGSSTNP